VFVPTAFIPGITGDFIKQFAMTIAISVMLSAFNALTLSPALAGLLLRPKPEEGNFQAPRTSREILCRLQSLLGTQHEWFSSAGRTR